MVLRVGITGGIGSGKSTVSAVFETLDIPVYYADKEAKNILQHDPALREQIIKLFGPEAYIDGTLNRSFLAEKVFSDQEQLLKLNALVHPKTIENANHWIQQQRSIYAIKEAALIFESGSQANLDFIIGVYAPASLRIKRTMNRDKISREAVMSRMKKQIDENIKMKLCDAVIMNDEQQLVIPQVLEIHEKLLLIAKKSIHQ